MCSYGNDPISLWCMEFVKTDNGPFILFGLLVAVIVLIGGFFAMFLPPFGRPAKHKPRPQRIAQPERVTKWEYPREQKPEPADEYDNHGRIIPANDGLFTAAQISRMSQEQVDSERTHEHVQKLHYLI